MLDRNTYSREPLVPEPSAFEVEMSMEKIKRPKSPGIDQIPAKLFESGSRTIHSEIHKLVNSVSNKEELPEECNKLFVVRIYKKGDKTDCNNYRDMSILSTMYKILYNILLSRLTPCAEEINGDHRCGF